LSDTGQQAQPGAPPSTLARWYLWEGGYLAVGRAGGVVPPHAHHAVQIVFGFDQPMRIKGEQGDWRSGHGIIVPPDVVHSFDGAGLLGAMLFVDPESIEGLWLRTLLRDEIAIMPEGRVTACVSELRTFYERPLEAMEIGALIRHCVASLCTGGPPARRLDDRVTRVLKHIRDSEELRVTLEDAAALAFLSPSRFAHLFKEQVGLPFRRYMLWRKLARAMVSIGRERTLAAAAHAADFADAAHLTRTFNEMFGIPPSVMMRGEFFEVRPPFELAASPRA
jgi:AraC-like DNA-binding protein